MTLPKDTWVGCIGVVSGHDIIRAAISNGCSVHGEEMTGGRESPEGATRSSKCKKRDV